MKSDSYINKKGQQIDFTVHVERRPNLRDKVDEFLMYRGKDILEIMFDQCVVDNSVTSFEMIYPERWANILELRAIPDRMLECFPNLEKVFIRTHSVYLIQCVHGEHIGIIKMSDEDLEKYNDGDYRNINKRYCPPPNEMKGLWSMTPSDELKKNG